MGRRENKREERQAGTLTARGAKAVEAGGTEVTAAPRHRRFTQALAAVGFALGT